MSLRRILSVAVVSVLFAAQGDVVLFKEGGRIDGTVSDGVQPGTRVIVTRDLEQARAMQARAELAIKAAKKAGKKGGKDQDPLAVQWLVEVREADASITLPADQIEEVVDPSRDASPLLKALEHPDKRVRYAASVAMARIRPRHAVLGADKVIRNLADAAGEAGIRVVLVVSDDGDLRNRLGAQVRSAQSIPVGAASAFDCLSCLSRAPGKDLILLDASLGRRTQGGDPSFRSRTAEENPELARRLEEITHYREGDRELPPEKRYARELYLRLQDDFRARTIPVIVVADASELDLARKIYAGQRVAGFLPTTASDDDVKSVLAGVFTRDDPALRDSKDLADEASRAACRALAGLERHDPVFPVADAEQALVHAFSESTEPRRVDSVRIAAMDAAGVIASGACYEDLLKVLSASANPDEVRRAAAKAIADILKAEGRPAPVTVVDGLQKALQDPDAGVWTESARGLGLSQTDLARIRDVWMQERLEKSLKE